MMAKRRELEITTAVTPEGIPHIEWRPANLGPSLSSERHQLGIQIRVEFGQHDCGIRNNKNPLSRIRNSSGGNPACATVYQSRCCLVTMATSTLNTFVSVLRSNSRRMNNDREQGPAFYVPGSHLGSYEIFVTCIRSCVTLLPRSLCKN